MAFSLILKLTQDLRYLDRLLEITVQVISHLSHIYVTDIGLFSWIFQFGVRENRIAIDTQRETSCSQDTKCQMLPRGAPGGAWWTKKMKN